MLSDARLSHSLRPRARLETHAEKKTQLAKIRACEQLFLTAHKPRISRPKNNCCEGKHRGIGTTSLKLGR